MADPQYGIGDGQDNFAGAASNAAKAAGQIGKNAANQAAVKGAEAAAKAATAAVKTGVETGKAVSEIAAGTAAGGPWGAAIAAVWSMRHTLFKVLICICLAVVFLIVMVVSLPSILFDSLFGSDSASPVENATVTSVYADMCDSVSAVIESGYQQSMAQVNQIIADGGYDRDASMNALINDAQSSAGYDTCYILAAYSASMQQKNTGKDDMVAKLDAVAADMFPVTYEEKTEERTIPATYYEYTPVTLTVVTRTVWVGTVNGVPKYDYETQTKTYYTRGEQKETSESMTVDTFGSVSVTLPIYSGETIIGTQTVSYYQKTGTQTIAPTVETIKYAECTVHPFDPTVITAAFGIDPDAQYGDFNTTYAQAIDNMANALKMTIYGRAPSEK